MVMLGSNRYGKAEVRVVHIGRGLGPNGADVIRDWNVSSSLSGDLAGPHLNGDNSNVLTTDTQKNTDFVFAKNLSGGEPETYAMALAEHFVTSQDAISRARIKVHEYPWTQIPVGTSSFARSGQYVRGAVVIHDQELGTSVVSGVDDLIVMNTTNSEFWGFPQDQYTTLPETKDRILATQVSAWWRHTGDLSSIDWATTYQTALDTLLTTFAGTYSYALQQTLFAIGTKIIEAVPSVCEVRLTLPNKHHFLVDMEPFGLDNVNEVYWAADRPYGLIEGTALADDAPAAGVAWD